MNNNQLIEFNAEKFRSQFPELATIAAPQAWWNAATNIISNNSYGLLACCSREQALYLMTAHLVQISNLVANGQQPGIVTDAQIDKIRVATMPPPVGNQWQWWLSQTPYGAQLLALLQVKSVGGFYIPSGPPEINSIRKAYGVF